MGLHPLECRAVEAIVSMVGRFIKSMHQGRLLLAALSPLAVALRAHIAEFLHAQGVLEGDCGIVRNTLSWTCRG